MTVKSRLCSIHTDLGYDDFETTRRAVGRVLHVLRKSLSPNVAHDLAVQLPSDWLIIYLSSWQYNEASVDIRHLDELIANIKEYDESRPEKVFRSEIEILKCTLHVISFLDSTVAITSYMPLTLSQEVKQSFVYSVAG